MSLAKPCPSCDSANHELKFDTAGGYYHIECRVCHMSGSRKQDPAAAIAAWNDLPRFHGVPQAPNEFWRGSLFPTRKYASCDNTQMQQVQLRLNVLEEQVAALFRLADLFKQYMEADVGYLTGVRGALKDLEESLETIGKR